jgi:hypothetical protein
MNKKGSCWEGYVQKGMKKKGDRMVPNCVPGMKSGGLTKWFNEKWVDIGAKKICQWFKSEVSEVRTTCKSHSNDKVAKGICCCQKKISK